MLEASLGEFFAAKHAGYFLGALEIVHAADLGLGSAALFRFFDEEVLIAEGRDLWEVGDAEDLLAFGQGFELAPYGLGRATADADVDLVEDEGAGEDGLLPAAGGTGCTFFDRYFEGQHDA